MCIYYLVIFKTTTQQFYNIELAISVAKPDLEKWGPKGNYFPNKMNNFLTFRRDSRNNTTSILLVKFKVLVRLINSYLLQSSSQQFPNCEMCFPWQARGLNREIDEEMLESDNCWITPSFCFKICLFNTQNFETGYLFYMMSCRVQQVIKSYEKRRSDIWGNIGIVSFYTRIALESYRFF
ncbi:hypothetical protein AGLY_008815 [Aphis glycines]|uniref:Uncharacterized protein n=1 Tax=Aphis glycines TaxID=307491 RepID=A0A6G0TJU0_APHGL|nr:hypothetical protein AGLY_008815 [Aphis glycines]